MSKFDHIFKKPIVVQDIEFGTQYFELDNNGKTEMVYIQSENDKNFVVDILLQKGDEVLPMILSNLRLPYQSASAFEKRENSEIHESFEEYIDTFARDDEDPVFYLTLEQWSDVLEHFYIKSSEKEQLLRKIWLAADNYGWGCKVEMLFYCTYLTLEYENIVFLNEDNTLYIARSAGETPLHKLIKHEYLNPEVTVNGYSSWIFHVEVSRQ